MWLQGDHAYLPESKWSVVSWLRRQGILDNYLSIIIFLAINSFKYHLREAPFRKTSTLGVLFLQWHKVCRISQEASDLPFSKFFWVKTSSKFAFLGLVGFCCKWHCSVWEEGWVGSSRAPLPLSGRYTYLVIQCQSVAKNSIPLLWSPRTKGRDAQIRPTSSVPPALSFPAFLSQFVFSLKWIFHLKTEEKGNWILLRPM